MRRMSQDETARDKESDEDSPKEPAKGFAVVAWGLVLFTACRLLEIVLEAQATASAVGQAVLVEWATARLGVVWTDPAHVQGRMRIARRGFIGVGVGFVAALLVIVLLLVSRGVMLEGVPDVAVSVLAVGLVTAGLHAWRDELLLHGVVLRALGMFDRRSTPNDLHCVLACGATSAGAALGRSDASPQTVAVTGALGIVFGALWVRDRGAWMPWGAHVAFRFATDTLIAGGVVQARLAGNRWAGGDAGILAGTAALVALGPLATAAVVTSMRRMSPDPPRVG